MLITYLEPSKYGNHQLFSPYHGFVAKCLSVYSTETCFACFNSSLPDFFLCESAGQFPGIFRRNPGKNSGSVGLKIRAKTGEKSAFSSPICRFPLVIWTFFSLFNFYFQNPGENPGYFPRKFEKIPGKSGLFFRANPGKSGHAGRATAFFGQSGRLILTQSNPMLITWIVVTCSCQTDVGYLSPAYSVRH